MLFWNVAGVGNKDEKFWEFVSSFDYISMFETWLEEKDWDSFKRGLPDSHKWEMKGARIEQGKGRAMGGFIIGGRKGVITDHITDNKERRINDLGMADRRRKVDSRISIIWETGKE